MRQKASVLFFVVLVSAAIFNYGAVPASERAALIALYNSTDGDHWSWNYGWKTPPLAADGFARPGTEKDWAGVSVSGDTVTGINLYDNEAHGVIPPELEHLSNLQRIDFFRNSLSGAIPPGLGKLSRLQELSLSKNSLSGSIPPELGNLSNLQTLALGENELSGPIPTTLGNLSNLKELYLYNNQLSGPIPAELGNLSNLQILNFEDNQLDGAIPATLGNLSDLKYLLLPGNQLSGPMPSTLGDLYNLKILDLSNNQLSGAIPAELGNLSNLENLSLTSNQLSGPIPPELGNLSNLYHFLLSHNLLSGEIPVTLTHFTKIDFFAIGYNCLYTNDFLLRLWLNTRDPFWENHQDQCTPSIIILNPSHLYFGATIGGATSAPQTVIIKNIGAAPLAWTAAGDTPWLNVSPTSGTGPGMITISINPAGLSTETFTGAITASAPNAGNSPQTISVTLKIFDNGDTAAPFGDFATPLNGSTVSGSIPVTGWVLDDIGVNKVEIFDGVNYIGEASFVEGARPDVEQAYPDYPQNYKAGWGYMLLTNFLANGGDGTYTLNAIATDVEGNEVTLGSKTITCDNAHARIPFGAIDTPTQGDIVSGKSFVNYGWALTPPPDMIPKDGSAIDVWVDGKQIGNPTYNIYREDIAALFPGYKNSNGAGGHFYLDTTLYVNGVHTIHWTATDGNLNTGVIGSRYFSIMNTGNSSSQGAHNTAADMLFTLTLEDLENLPGKSTAPGKMIKGYGKDEEACEYELFPDRNGINRVSIKELERIVIQLGENLADVADVRGYMIIDGGLRPLPIGSTLAKKAGKFYWSPGPGFYGKYDLVFLIKDGGGQWSKKMIEINIDSRFDRND